MLQKNAASFIPLEKLGTVNPEYAPTYSFEGEYINENHRYYAICPVKDGYLIQVKMHLWSRHPIGGWLQRPDALKLYEMAYFAEGDILEIGSFHGLSTSVMAQAVRDSGGKKIIHTDDLAPDHVRITSETVRKRGLSRYVQSHEGDGLVLVQTYAEQGKQFAFAFIDHAHDYQPVYDLCRELHKIITPGGFCLFHDFNDPRNPDDAFTDYGVYQAVQDGLKPDQFEFYGIFGCTGLYRAL